MKIARAALFAAPFLLLQAAGTEANMNSPGKADADAMDPSRAESSKLAVATHEKYGKFLANGEGRPLYLFTSDTQGKGGKEAQSTCYESCAKAWPPVTAEAKPQSGEEIKAGLIGTVTRKDGQKQVTYNGWPLYTFIQDRGESAPVGQDMEGFGGEWYLVTPAGEKVREDGEKEAM